MANTLGLIASCVADVLPIHTVAGESHQNRRYNLDWLSWWWCQCTDNYCWLTLPLFTTSFHSSRSAKFWCVNKKSPQPPTKHPSHILDFDLFLPMRSCNILSQWVDVCTYHIKLCMSHHAAGTILPRHIRPTNEGTNCLPIRAGSVFKQTVFVR